MISIPYPVSSARCITINSDTQIYVYPTDYTRDTFILFGDTWKKTSTTTTTRAYDFNSMVCQDISAGIPYQNPESEVYLNVLSIACFIGIIYFAYRLIVHKFWRKV